MTYAPEFQFLVLVSIIVGAVLGWQRPGSWWYIIPSWALFLAVNAAPESPPPEEKGVLFYSLVFFSGVWMFHTLSSALRKIFG